MRVCFIAPKAYQLFNPSVQSTFGGAEVQLYLLAKQLSINSSAEVQVVTADYGYKQPERFGRITVWPSYKPSDPVGLKIYKVIGCLRRIHPDVCIQRTLTSFSPLLALYCRLMRKRFIYMLANDGEADGSHPLARGLGGRLRMKLLISWATVMVVQNNYQKRALQSYFHGDSFLLPPAEVLSENGAADQKEEYLLWVGRIDQHYKNPEAYLQLAHDFPKERFLMIGPPATGQENYYNDIKTRAQRLSNLTYIDFVPYEQIDRYFSNAKLLINTSVQEGFANTFIQAAKHQIPILSMSVNPDNILHEHHLGYCADGAYPVFTGQLRTLLSNPELRRTLGHHGKIYASKYHDIRKNADKFYQLIASHRPVIKICFVSVGAYALFNPNASAKHGGSELQLYYLGTELARSPRYAIHYAVGDYGQPPIEQFGKVTIHRGVTPTPGTFIHKLRETGKLFKCLRTARADLYITTTANPIAGLVNIYTRIFGVKHIHRTAHSTDVGPKPIDLHGLNQFLYQYGLRHADIVLTQNETDQAALKRFYQRSAVVFKNVIPFPESAEPTSDRKSILWVARFARWKRPELYLKLASEFPDLHFVMICPSIRPADASWQALLNKCSHIPNIEFIKHATVDQTQAYFRQAIAFVNTSEYEGFPNTFLQAGLARTPIISLAVDPDSFIAKNDCGYYCGDNYQTMKAALAELISDPPIRARKGNSAYQYVAQNHDLVKNTAALSILIDSLLVR